MPYVGLDVFLNSVAICVVDENGKLIREGMMSADAPSMGHHLEPLVGQVDRVGLEAGPTSEWLIANLIELFRTRLAVRCGVPLHTGGTFKDRTSTIIHGRLPRL